ncbi:TSL-kinase interacting protein 1-like isoform X2 [Aristolochia californica]|uniref:TSL-kinase interacting protein 1-like isoform X2 n=1 Tax=Aristolochia californica TaxID=171875 RepID=UPI0035E3971A
MHTEPHIGVEPEAHTSGNVLKKNADLGAASPCPKAVIIQNPVKKQTRQWAAWTRQEEENFFNALRLVGKDFDKITYRVQTKNKDQVRHYYYRLIRRMNKLLGPGFCLDAKNSKDTIAAMLRWWSLLEKYSCTASKLHLKPRRFKVFVEALEHQLLKDRKKSRRRRSHGECCHPSPSTATISLLSKAHGNDARLMKVLIVDGHNVQKVVSAKATSSLKHNVSTTSSCNRSDPTLKNVRQRRRTGNMSPACDKMEEKAVTYGVSLVAYAAEHLEQTTGSVNRGCHDQSQAGNEVELPHNLSPSKNLLSPTSQRGCLQNIPEINGQLPVKLKLQLFPVNEVTRLALEKDEHNPHLELTLSARKKMCSVLEHLNRKWGHSSIILSGELMIFPYSRQEALSSFKRWTSKDTVSTAADVYAAIGCPSVFRLRYGWFPHLEVKAVSLPASVPQSLSTESNKSQPASTAEGTFSTSSSKHKLSKAFPVDQECNNPVSSGCISHSLCLKESSGVMKNHWEDGETVRASDGIILSAGEWADSLTNITVGDLLSEASRAADANYSEPPAPCLQSIPFSCDSFDAAIAAHISSGSKELQNHVSIWDGEETRDAFSFQKLSPFNRDVSSSTPGASLNRNISHDYPVGHHGLVEDLGAIGSTNDLACERNPVGGSISSGQDHDDSQRGQSSTDMFWPDSLGPLDLDVCSRYQGPELILGDSVSLSGLNRLIASSLDAFQSCSFFNSDKKECLASETDRVKISSNITYER